MKANTTEIIGVRLRTPVFDAAARNALGLPDDAPQHRIAAALDIDAASLSLIRNGHRRPGVDFIVAVLANFGRNGHAADFETYFEIVSEAAA